MDNLQKLMNEISEWSDATFGDGQRNLAIVHHLKKEVGELIEALNKSTALGCDNSVGVGEFKRQLDKTKMEFADCFMLLLDSARHFSLSAEQLINLTREKLEINKHRHWSTPDQNGVIEHIRMKSGIELIAKERLEQIEKHGYTIGNDVAENQFNQLVAASIMLLDGYPHQDEENHTPFKWDEENFNKMMNKNKIERYKIAGALIAAEIDRLQALESLMK